MELFVKCTNSRLGYMSHSSLY